MSELSMNPIDHDTYCQLEELMGDEGFHQIIDFFMSDTDQSMTTLPQAISAQKPDQVGAICHKLKSSCKLVGAFPMAKLCSSLEQYAEHKDAALAGQVFLKLKAEFEQVEQQLKEEMIIEL